MQIERKLPNGVIEIAAGGWRSTVRPGDDLMAEIAGPDKALTPEQRVEIEDWWSEEVEPGVSRAQAWEAVAHPPEPEPDLAAYAAERRWRAETGGIEVSGMSVRTDRESQALITGAALAAQLDSNLTLRWKCADGSFVTLDASQLIAVAQTVAAHVQACFAMEADVLADIAAEDVTSTAEIDAAFEALEGGA